MSEEALKLRKPLVKRHTDLEVYQLAFTAAMEVFELSKRFPKEETYSLTDQMSRSPRSVCANLAEAWRKRRYEAAFISKLGECEAEAAETQTWLQVAVQCGYLERETVKKLFQDYDHVIAMLVRMITNADHWTIK
jgi:four helix bundle protein